MPVLSHSHSYSIFVRWMRCWQMLLKWKDLLRQSQLSELSAWGDWRSHLTTPIGAVALFVHLALHAKCPTHLCTWDSCCCCCYLARHLTAFWPPLSTRQQLQQQQGQRRQQRQLSHCCGRGGGGGWEVQLKICSTHLSNSVAAAASRRA